MVVSATTTIRVQSIIEMYGNGLLSDTSLKSFQKGMDLLCVRLARNASMHVFSLALSLHYLILYLNTIRNWVGGGDSSYIQGAGVLDENFEKNP